MELVLAVWIVEGGAFHVCPPKNTPALQFDEKKERFQIQFTVEHFVDKYHPVFAIP